jgi:copper chaperone CopZ
MKKGLYLLAVLCLAAMWVGCNKTEPAADASSAITLVKLKVPNMTWGGCAASVRGDLVKIDGVTDIETDIANRTCSFKLTKPGVDYKAKLAEFAKTNSKLAGYEIL